MGWDSLQTELYPWLAVKRALFSVWEEYQGLGLVGGMAHAADLVRAVFLWVLSFVVPASLIRYLFHTSMLFIGGIGVYRLLLFLGFRENKKLLALVGSVFYILNLGTVQLFGIPFEPFSVFFGFLPWEIYIFLKFLEKDKVSKKILLEFVLINLLATPQAYVQVLFLVYLLVLGCFVMVFLGTGGRISVIPRVRRSIVGILLLFCINAFWILPQVYFLTTNSSVFEKSKINEIATPRVVNQNLEKGKLKYFARLEGFYYDTYDATGKLLFQPWKGHLDKFPLAPLSYLVFPLLLLGLFSKRKYHMGFVLIFLLVSVGLMGNELVFSYINDVLRRNGFINQIFRSPFTKFITAYSLVAAYLLVSGLDLIYKKIKYRKLQICISVLILSSIVICNLPAFWGNFFVRQMKVKVPKEYLEVMDYFRNSVALDKRIALLPDYTFWGWFKSKWGYDGSGFLWYGIEQPTISRTFDVWSPHGESYFWEIKEAIEDQNVSQFEKVLDKYNVDYLIFDRNLLPVASDIRGLQYDQIDNILRSSSKVELQKTFGELSVYLVKRDSPGKDFLRVMKDAPNIGPQVRVMDIDNIYLQHGDYLTTNQKYDYFYPFLDFMTKNKLDDRKWKISENVDQFIIEYPLNDILKEGYMLEGGSAPKNAEVFLAEEGGGIKKFTYEAKSDVEGDKLIVKVKKILIKEFDPKTISIENCSYPREGSVDKIPSFIETGISVKSEGRGKICFGYFLPTLAHWNGYLFKVGSKLEEGSPLFFYITGNKNRKQAKIESDLRGPTDYFLISPGYYFDDGYEFSFQGFSYGNRTSVARIYALELYLFPFDYVKNIRFQRVDATVNGAAQLGALPETNKLNYSMYEVGGIPSTFDTLVLGQAFESGWIALCGNKVCPAKHVLVNNWANGWVFENNSYNGKITIFFWPQVLEYVGFAMFLFCLLILFIYKNEDSK